MIINNSYIKYNYKNKKTIKKKENWSKIYFKYTQESHKNMIIITNYSEKVNTEKGVFN